MTLGMNEDYVTAFTQDCLTCHKLKCCDKNMYTPSFSHCSKNLNPMLMVTAADFTLLPTK